jgi:hypothetical protein
MKNEPANMADAKTAYMALRMTPIPAPCPHLRWGNGSTAFSCLTPRHSLMRVTFFRQSLESPKGSGKSRKAGENRLYRH